jgi:hypothetical protein
VSQRQKVVWRNARATLLCLALLAGSGAWAQIGASVLTGNVVDAATKAPVGDVVVTATSPGLQGEQVVVTDATGLYRIPQLPPGTYTLRFEKESYRPFSRTGIDVSPDRTLRLNVELLPETAGATEISVVGSPPVVDVGSSTTGANINQDFVRNLAVARPGGLAGANRSFESLALTAPQAQADVYGVAINGAQSPEQLYLVDGLSTNSPAYGVNGTPITSEFIDEVNVITGGYMPEYGRTTGGAISAVTKSGGNEFHGSVFGTWTPGGLTGAPAPITTASATITANVQPFNIGDVGATLGGYIIKDKLWFFAGIQYASTRLSYTRSFNILQGGVRTPIANSEQRRFGDEHSWNYIGKLTFQVTPDHRLAVTVTGTPTSGGGGASFQLRTQAESRGTITAGALAGGTFNSLAAAQKVDSMDIAGEYNGSFLDKKLLLDVKGGWHHQLNSTLPPDGSRFDVDNVTTLAGTPTIRSRSNVTNITLLDGTLPPSVYAACGRGNDPASNTACGVANYFYGGTGFINETTLNSYQFRAVVTYLLSALGHHVLKAGFDYQAADYDIQSAYTGGSAYRTLGQGGPGAGGATGNQGGSTPTVYDYRRYGRLTDVDVLNDEPVVHRVVKSQIAGGFVQDSWSILDKVTVNLGLRYDALAMQGADGLNRLVLNDQWSPRVGAVWDPTQQGRAKIYANYGIYYENIPLDLANRSLSAEVQPRGAHACDPLVAHRAGCDANTIPGVFVAGPGQLWAVTGAPYPSAIDPNVKSPSNEELVAGAEYEVLPNARLAASYTHRNYRRALEDMSNTDGQTYFIGNPGEGIADSFPKAKRVYDAVTVSFNKTFSDLWLAQISYTWSRLTGNYDGLWSPNYQQQLDPNITANFDLKTLLLNGDGILSADITHYIKVYLAKEFVITPVFSVSLGGSFNANSGGPVDYLGAHPIYGDGLAYLLVRGSAGRLPWVTSLDGKVNFNYRFTKDLVLTAAVEAFNIFNSQRPTLLENRYTQAAVGPIIGATPGNVPPTFGGTCPEGTTNATIANCTQGNGNLPKPYTYADGNRGLVVLPSARQVPNVVQVFPTWGRPTAYQAVRQFRFSLRLTF